MSDLLDLMPKTERLELEAKIDKLEAKIRKLKKEWKKPISESEWWSKFGHCDHICEVEEVMLEEGYITPPQPAGTK